MKVYIVVQETRDECVNHGIYSMESSAINVAYDLAEYAGLELVEDTDEFIWTNYDEDMEIRIESHDVIID